MTLITIIVTLVIILVVLSLIAPWFFPVSTLVIITAITVIIIIIFIITIVVIVGIFIPLFSLMVDFLNRLFLFSFGHFLVSFVARMSNPFFYTCLKILKIFKFARYKLLQVFRQILSSEGNNILLTLPTTFTQPFHLPYIFVNVLLIRKF